MIYFLDGDFDKDGRLQWCKDNEIFYLSMWMILFPVLLFTLGFLPKKKLDIWLRNVVIFNKANAMAYKLRWL